MSDQPNTPPETPPATPPAAAAPAKPEGDKPGPIPYERFSEVNDKLKAAQTEAEELRKYRDDQEAAKLSEIERAQKLADEATQGKTAAEQRAVAAERRLDIWKAAQAAGFEDPEDAVVWLRDRVDTLDDADKVKAAVAKLAEDKPKLLRSGQQTPTPIGGLTPQTPSGEIPVGADGKPDVKAGIGRDLMSSLLGRQ